MTADAKAYGKKYGHVKAKIDMPVAKVTYVHRVKDEPTMYINADRQGKKPLYPSSSWKLIEKDGEHMLRIGMSGMVDGKYMNPNGSDPFAWKEWLWINFDKSMIFKLRDYLEFIIKHYIKQDEPHFTDNVLKKSQFFSDLVSLEHDKWVKWTKVMIEKKLITPEMEGQWEKYWVNLSELPEGQTAMGEHWAMETLRFMALHTDAIIK